MHCLRNGTVTVPEETSAESRPPTAPGGSSGRGFNRTQSLKVLIVVLTVLLLGTYLAVLRRRKSPDLTDKAVVALPASVASTLRLKGTTEAVHSRSILSPMLSGEHVGALTITKLAGSGTHVKRGDLLVEFDRQGQMRTFFDKQAEYENLVEEVIQEQATQDAARAKDETDLRQAENNVKDKELDMQKVELLSRIEAEKAQEHLEASKATLQQLRATFDLKRQAARAAIRILEIRRDRTRSSMVHAEANADLMQVRSPMDGLLVLNVIWKEGKMGEVQEGDQIRPGQPFMQVVDPSVMQVRVLANQQDFLALKIGQPVTVRLDAYPELLLPGRLEQISPIGRGNGYSPRVRTFAVVFSIKGTDPRLMPDLSAAVDLDMSITVSTFQGATR